MRCQFWGGIPTFESFLLLALLLGMIHLERVKAGERLSQGGTMPRQAMSHRVGAVRIKSLTGMQLRKTGSTPSGQPSQGVAELFELDGPQRLRLTVAVLRWRNGERNVETEHRHTSPERLDRLRHGLRLTLNNVPSRRGIWWAELRQARVKPCESQWSNLFKASLDELDAAAEVDTRAELLSVGAQAVGTRSKLLGDEGLRRTDLCVTYRADDLIVPVVAYTITRVLPILREWPA